MSSPAVSFVVPVYNGAALLPPMLDAVLREADRAGVAAEVVAVDDRSADGSRAVLAGYAARDARVRIVDGEGRGAASAINAGIRAARAAVICQIDQDVILCEGWLAAVLAELADPAVGAVQGYYIPAADASLWATVTGLDLAQRYDAIDDSGKDPDHVCTGNVAYRRSALAEVGLFDEELGYGYDNDMSYRLTAAGLRLKLARQARAVHRWRESLGGFLGQQYGVGYGRLDVVRKHPRRHSGDAVSRWRMMAHAPLMLLALAAACAAASVAPFSHLWRWPALAAGAVVALLAIERLASGAAAALRYRRATPLAFVFAHLLRDLAWACALMMWFGRRTLGVRGRPDHSMRR